MNDCREDLNKLSSKLVEQRAKAKEQVLFELANKLKWGGNGEN